MMIDFHTHTFPEKIAAKTLGLLGKAACSVPCTNGTADGLLLSMAEAGIDYSVTFSVATNPEQVEKLNTHILSSMEDNFQKGLLCFGAMHPAYDNYKQELKRLHDAHVPGIKLHPAYQSTDLDDIRMLRIMDQASELGMIISVHSGIDIGIPDHNYASVKHILHVLHEINPGRLVLAHMGGWACWKETEQYLAGAPVYLDTAFSLRPEKFHPDWKTNPQYKDNLAKEDFLRLCKKHGMDKILFATDSPWQNQKEYVTFIRELPLSDTEKEMILGENALKLLKSL